MKAMKVSEQNLSERRVEALWVSTPEVGKSNGRTYDIQKSSTATPYPNETFLLGFPQSSVSGIVVADNLKLSDGTVLLGDFAFGLVHQESSGIVDQPFDGFLGLGFPGSSPNRTILDSKPTFFEAMMPRLESPIFALDFRNNANDSAGPSMELGRIDPTKYSGELAYTPIDRSTNRWTANGITFTVRGQVMSESASMSFDTGGDNNIYAPMSIVDEYYSQITDLRWGSQLGNNNCTVIIPCSSELSDLEMHIGNGTTRVRRENMMGRPLTGPANPAWAASSGTLCVPTLQAFGSYPERSCFAFGLIGAPMFHENYVVFNHAEPSVLVRKTTKDLAQDDNEHRNQQGKPLVYFFKFLEQI
ncbi:MAG: hypothetical protein Q9220_005275 [cf. Caloplaca sp. 1 TL-2023]